MTDDLLTCDRAARLLVEADTYTDEVLVRRVCEVLRTGDPVHLVEHPDFPPLWALTRNADIREIELGNRKFVQGPYPFLETLEAMRRNEASRYPTAPLLVRMDGEEHRAMRGVTAAWFTPRNLAKLDARLGELAGQAVDRMASLGGQCDFAAEVAVPFPFQVILSILGLPESDYAYILKLSQQIVAPLDDEFGVSGGDQMQAIVAFFNYFAEVVKDRRAHPRDDLATVIATAELPEGRTYGLGEMIGYFVTLAVAGHDTTSASIASGLLALIEHPDQRARLQADATLMGTAVEEIIRWATPVKHFTRTCAVPYRLREHEFAPGDRVLLSYPAANFDPEAVADPYTFDVGRSPNNHLGFGVGAHFCLGAHLARKEIGAFVGQLLPRLRGIELNGSPAWIGGLGVGGVKHLPVRYQLD